MHDGIENAGIGMHSSDALEWKNLAGSDASSVFSCRYEWLDNCACIYAKSTNGCLKIRGLPSMADFTFEIVHRIDDRDIYGRLYENEQYTSNDASKRFCCITGPGKDGVVHD